MTNAEEQEVAILLEAKRCGYIEVPKVACSSIKIAFPSASAPTERINLLPGVATATNLEKTTDTLNATSRLRGSLTSVVRRTDQGWKAAAATVTEHRSQLP